MSYLLATSRWGSYIGVPSHRWYISDALLVVTFGWVLTRHRSRLDLSWGALLSVAPVAALIAWSLVRFAAGGEGGFDAFRDLAPYVYAVVAACSALVRTGAAARSRSLTVLTGALVVHLVWVAVSAGDAGMSSRLPLLGNDVHVLDLRPDVDGAALAVLAGICIHVALADGARWTRRVLGAVLALACAALVLQLANRAGLLALLVAGLSVAVVDRRVLARASRRRTAGMLLSMGLVAAVVVPSTNLYQRVSGDPEFDTNPAAATQKARLLAWRDVLDYLDDSPRTIAVGVGFGPDFVMRSGASLLLQGPGDSGVRAPHSFMVNTYARLGVVGIAVLGWLFVAGARAAAVAARRPGGDDLTLAALLVTVTLLVTSLVGVVLEAPFGALPFFWAVGLLLADARLGPRVARGEHATANGSGEGVRFGDVKPGAGP